MDTSRQGKPQKINVIYFWLAWLSTGLQWKRPTIVISEQTVHVSQHNSVALDFNPCPDLISQLKRPSCFAVAYGGYGDVHRCVLRSGLQDTEMLPRELSVWDKLENENILPFYGVSFGFGPLPALVCDMGSGVHYRISPCSNYRFIVHCSQTNVLINAADRASLSDFGLSTIHQEFLGMSYFITSSRGILKCCSGSFSDGSGCLSWLTMEVGLLRPEVLPDSLTIMQGSTGTCRVKFNFSSWTGGRPSTWCQLLHIIQPPHTTAFSHLLARHYDMIMKLYGDSSNLKLVSQTILIPKLHVHR
ncbi:hypothetical protein BU15DRAFT_60682 [Melanogaster broomeanus]|nr:hypothetical protein BU15DRAFT_60682 [Melanogaster broomeanus]